MGRGRAVGAAFTLGHWRVEVQHKPSGQGLWDFAAELVLRGTLPHHPPPALPADVAKACEGRMCGGVVLECLQVGPL